MGIDRLELRRRNHIQPDADALQGRVRHAPTTAATSPPCSSRRVEVADWEGFDAAQAREPQARQAARPRHRQLSRSHRAADQGDGRHPLRGRTATVTIITGTLDYGQGHAAPFAQVLTERLGVPFERIRLLQGDSDELIAGGGTGGSQLDAWRAAPRSSKAPTKVIEKGKQIAAPRAGGRASPTSSSTRGRFTIAGTDRAIGIMELAEQLRAGDQAAGGRAEHARRASTSPTSVPSAFPNGCHVAEVEVDPDTGVIEVVRYISVNDFGTVINPLLVEGQVHGGVVQGIGQALMETTRLRRRRPAADRLVHGLRAAARRATCRSSASTAIRCRRRPIRSASRAAARPAAPAR